MKICKGCGLAKPIWSKGMCLGCSKPNFKKISPKVKVKKDGGYTDFYASQIERFSKDPYSFVSGTYISEIGTVNIAHIFPKEKYKSISKTPDNIVLMTWGEHTRFDELLSTHRYSTLEEEFEEKWLLICEMIKKLIPLAEETGSLMRSLIIYLK